MKNQVLRSMIEASNGKMMSITFTKKNGELRKMNCRTGVKCKLRGGVSTNEGKDHLITVYDVQKRAYRCVNLDTVSEVCSQGRRYKVSEGDA